MKSKMRPLVLSSLLHTASFHVIAAGLFLLLLHNSVHAQTANNYTYSTGTGASLLAPTFSSTIVTLSTDDAVSGPIAFGFNFVYEGITYTSFSVNSNGLMRLGNTGVSNSWSNNITLASDQPKIMPLWDDLNSSTDGGIVWGVSGSAPNRILVVDYKTTNNGVSAPYNCNYQVWLYETTGEIRFVYGTGTTPLSFSCGIGGAVATNFQSVTTNTHTCSNSVANNTNATWPGSGRYYSFIYTPPCTAPTTQATMNAYTNNTTGTSLDVNWTRGNGTGGVLIVGRLTSTPAVNPISGTTYTANPTFGSGSTTGTGNFVVYNGTGTTVNVTNLAPSTAYTFTGYEYNTTGTCYMTPGAASTVTTSPLPVGTITLGANAPAAADQCAATPKVILQSFSLACSVANGNLTNVGFTTTGTYVQADIAKYQLWYNTSNTFTGATQLGVDLASAGGAGPRTFAAFTSPTLLNGSTYYFWITADLTAGVTNNNTIACNAIATTDLTSSSTKAGTTTAGGLQTLKANPTAANAGPSQSACNTPNYTLAGNNPAIGSGLWTCISGCTGVTITTPSANNSTVTGVAGGTPAVLEWTISNAPCAASTSTVTLSNSNTPSTQATIGAYTNNITGVGLTVNWTRGNGTAGVIVVGRLTSTTAVDPVDGVSYNANAAFGAGSSTGAGNFVVYKGTGTSTNVAALTSNTNYTFTVYEYSGLCYLAPGSSSAVTTTASVPQWFQQTSGMPGNLYSIHCVDSNNCFVSGTTNNVRKTTDGSTWNMVGSNGLSNKLCVKMLNKDTIMLLQDNGTFKRSTNGGALWSVDIPGGNVNFDLFDIAYISNTDFTAVGGNPANQATGGHITTSSTNTGATFPTFVNVSGEPIFYGIHAINSGTFVACAGAASVYKTIDGGATWTAKFIGAPSTTSLFDINFPTDSIGYAAGGNSAAPTTAGVVYKTTDAGETWVPASAGLLPNSLFGVHFVNKDTGYVVGDGGTIQVTKDGGLNWSQQLSPVTTTLNKVYFPTEKIGYICGANGVILKTINGGFNSVLAVNAGADASICLGGCVTLTSAVSGGTPPYAYAWSPGSGTGTSLVVCPTSTTTYSLTITDSNNVVMIDSVTVTIYNNPAFGMSGLDSLYCNSTTSITVSVTPTGGALTGPGITAGVFDAAAAGVGTHTVTYTFTTSDGCVLVDSQVLTVVPSADSIPICIVTVDSSMNNTTNYIVWEKPVAANIDSFRVYRGGTHIASVAYSAPSMYADGSAAPNTQKSDYSLTALDSCGIESIASMINSTMYLSPSAFVSPSSFTLSWTDFTGFAFSNYEIWRTIDNGVTWTYVTSISTVFPKTYTDIAPSLNARYRIRATKPTPACTVNSSVFSYSLSNVSQDQTAIHDLSISNLLNVYPNPNHGKFNVEFSSPGYAMRSVSIYTILGEKVYSEEGMSFSSEINVPELLPGIYHLEVITDKGVANKKITIE